MSAEIPDPRSLAPAATAAALRFKLSSLFPDTDHRFHLGLQRGSIENFFGPWQHPPDLLRQRTHWLKNFPTTYAALHPDGIPLLHETIRLLKAGGMVLQSPSDFDEASAHQHLLATGCGLEPDFLLLKREESDPHRLVGGAVCFPSSWSLEEKMGHTIDFIHAPVPGLNAQLGHSITAFLQRLAPGHAWLRYNWGLTRSPELNHHPARQLPRLDASVTTGEIFLRVEHQALVALPETRGILFAIRVTVHPIAEVLSQPSAASGLRRALISMSDDVAAYKGLASARTTLILMLDTPGV